MKGVTGETKRAKRDKRPDEDARGKCTSEKEDEEEEGGISEREERISGGGGEGASQGSRRRWRMVYDKARCIKGGFGVAARTVVRIARAGWREREKRRAEREREKKSLATGRSKAQRREMHHLCALVWQLCGRTTASACVRKREREREHGIGRDGERGREKGTDGSGRENDIYPATNTNAEGGGGQEENQAESRWARSGLPEFHTHTALLLRVPSRRREPHEGGGATPSRKRGSSRVSGSRE